MAYKQWLCLLLPVTVSTDLFLHHPEQCSPDKIPPLVDFMAIPAASAVDCAKKCEANSECSSMYFKEKCWNYSPVVDKDCSGFNTGTISSPGYFEVQQRCDDSGCKCARFYRGRSCEFSMGVAASFLLMDYIKDSKMSGRGETPAAGGGTPAFPPGKDGKALHMKYPFYLDYGDQRGKCLGNFDRCSSGWTAAMWLSISSAVAASHMLSSGGHPSSNTGVALTYKSEGKSLSCTIETSTKTWSAQTTMPLQTWYHVAVTWSSERGIGIYLNGKISAAETTGTSKASRTDTHKTFTVGLPNNVAKGDSSSAQLYADAYIDDLIIWEERRSTGDIASLFDTVNYKH